MKSPNNSNNIPVWGWYVISSFVLLITIAVGLITGILKQIGGFLSLFITDALPSLAVITILAALYFVPSLIAGKSPRSAAIFVANLLFGWTLIGWVIILIWALAESGTASAKTKTQPPLS